MKNYLDVYANESGVTKALNTFKLSNPYVAVLTDTNTIDWNSKKTEYEKIPLSFYFEGDGQFYAQTSHLQINSRTFEYCIWGENGPENWTQMPYILNVSAGDIISLRANYNSYAEIAYGDTIGYYGFNASCNFEVFGNIFSLMYGENFIGKTSFPATEAKKYAFTSFFQNRTNLTDVSNLILPATTLTTRCYREMFKGCTNLKTVKCLATDISATEATTNWLQNAAAAGTFIKATGVSWPTGVSGIPNGWTVIEE